MSVGSAWLSLRQQDSREGCKSSRGLPLLEGVECIVSLTGADAVQANLPAAHSFDRVHSFCLLLHRSAAAVPGISEWSGKFDPKSLAAQLHHVLLLCICKDGAMMQDSHIDRLAQDMIIRADLANQHLNECCCTWRTCVRS